MVKKLKCETKTPKMEARLLKAFLASQSVHEKPRAVFEHGQWYVSCPLCGALYSAHDAQGGDSVDGFAFEEIAGGDESCLENANTLTDD